MNERITHVPLTRAASCQKHALARHARRQRRCCCRGCVEEWRRVQSRRPRRLIATVVRVRVTLLYDVARVGSDLERI
jgi:hypothetical protein